METVKIAKNASYVKKNNKFFKKEINSYTGAVSVVELKENGDNYIVPSTALNSEYKISKDKLDVLFMK